MVYHVMSPAEQTIDLFHSLAPFLPALGISTVILFIVWRAIMQPWRRR